MTINSAFVTQVTAQTPATPVAGIAKQTALGGGLAFFDLFLASAEKNIDQKLSTLQTQQTGVTPTNPLLTEQTNTLLLEALANSEYTLDELSKIENPEAADVLALNQIINDELLLTTEIPGLPEGASKALQNAIITGEADFRPALNNLQRILQKLETLVNEGSPDLIGTNVTPQQITALQKKVDDLLQAGDTKDNAEEAAEFAGIFAGLIQILPPQAKADAIVKGVGPVTIEAPSIDIPEGAAPSDELAAKLNDLIVGGSETEALTSSTAPQAPAVKADASANTNTPQPQQTQGKIFNFADLPATPEEEAELTLKTESVVKTDGTIGKDGTTTAAKPQAIATPDLALLKSALPFLYSNDFSSALYTSATPVSGAEYGMPLMGLSATGTGLASSTVMTQAQHAALPHPGTQMVAATLQRTGAAGENRTMTLQLDPPELGRVEIKMSFEKNSKIKAVLTAEKPETYTLLQRDASVLERALQDAGLDSENGLSFELAKEGYTFGQDDNQSHGLGPNNRAETDGEDEIIQTTLQWAIDEQTGHMRYNITA